MAGIEKVCEFEKGGHWRSEEDPFFCYYPDTIQVCEKHRAVFTHLAKGRYHHIVVYPREWKRHYYRAKNGGTQERRIPCNIRDFELFVDGLPNPLSKENGWMRWYHDKRKWRRNMRKLLGVKRLNIEYAKEARP